MKSVYISDEECQKYHISRWDADKIVRVIHCFLDTMYQQKISGTLFKFKDEFPSEAMKYNRCINR